MSTYCYCDNCLTIGNTQLKLENCPTPKTLDEMFAEQLAEQGRQQEEESPVCPGYRTYTVMEQCGRELDWGEEICPTCVKHRHEQELIEDELVEQYYQRQLDLEESQLLALEDDED